MKTKDLIKYLQEFDQDKEILVFEMSDFYDTIVIGIYETTRHVRISIKNLPRGEEKKDIRQ